MSDSIPIGKNPPFGFLVPTIAGFDWSDITVLLLFSG
jgi:hypothetical protein